MLCITVYFDEDFQVLSEWKHHRVVLTVSGHTTQYCLLEYSTVFLSYDSGSPFVQLIDRFDMAKMKTTAAET